MLPGLRAVRVGTTISVKILQALGQLPRLTAWAPVQLPRLVGSRDTPVLPGLSSDLWLRARVEQERAGPSRDLLRGNLHHRRAENRFAHLSPPSGPPLLTHPHGSGRRTELLEFPMVCVTQSRSCRPGWDSGHGRG